jgi:N-methylhydantoinase A
VTLRCRLQGQALEIRLPAPAAGSPGTAVDNATVADCVQPVPVYARDRLAAGQRLTGPAIVTETVATTWLAPGWRCVVDPVGNLLLERGDG